VIAARGAVLRAAERLADAGGDAAAVAAVIDAVSTLRRVEGKAPRYTCSVCGLAVVVTAERTVRICGHDEAAILAHCRSVDMQLAAGLSAEAP